MPGLSNPRAIFGVHSFTPYSRIDGTPYGTSKVIASGTLTFSGALVELKGGSSKYPWAVEEGAISSQLQLKVREYPDFLFQLFAGVTPTENAADPLGGATALTNKSGTSVVNATTGIASVSVKTGSESDLKFGKYVVKALSATTVQVYCLSDVDFGRGTAEVFNDDTLALKSAAITITASTGSDITGWGLTLMGGSGTIGMTTGDTATFEVRPKNTANASWNIGQVGANFPEFGALLYAKKRDNVLFEIDCPRCKGEGVPIHLEEDKWSEADVKVSIMQDASLNYVARVRTVTPTTP